MLCFMKTTRVDPSVYPDLYATLSSLIPNSELKNDLALSPKDRFAKLPAATEGASAPEKVWSDATTISD